jgi:hypothetical protein
MIEPCDTITFTFYLILQGLKLNKKFITCVNIYMTYDVIVLEELTT